MKENTIILPDYSPIPEKYVAFCQEVQQAIDHGVMPVADLSILYSTKVEPSHTPLKLFQQRENGYWTQEYVGMLSYQGTRLILNSRFDQQSQGAFFQRFLLEHGVKNLRILYDEATEGGEGDLTQVLIPLFLVQLQKALEQGLYREYRRYQHSDSRFRGTLDLPRHIRENYLKNGKIAYHTREYTEDNPINLLILTAIHKLQRDSHTQKAFATWLAPLNALEKAIASLARSLPTPSVQGRDILALLGKTDRPISHPMFQNYEEVRQTAQSILRVEGLSLLETGSHLSGGVMFSLNKAWESLLEQSVFSKDAFEKESMEVFFQENMAFLEGSASVEIDFVVREKGGEALAVFDGKNKANWSRTWYDSYCRKKEVSLSRHHREDIFQLLSYLYLTKAQYSAVLFPFHPSILKKSTQEEQEEIIFVSPEDLDYWQYQWQIQPNLSDGKRFYALPVPLPQTLDGTFSAYHKEFTRILTLCSDNIRVLCREARKEKKISSETYDSRRTLDGL